MTVYGSDGAFQSDALGPLVCTVSVTRPPPPRTRGDLWQGRVKVGVQVGEALWCVAGARLPREGWKPGPGSWTLLQRPCLQLGSRRAQLSPGFPGGPAVSRVTIAGAACVCLWSLPVCARVWCVHTCVHMCASACAHVWCAHGCVACVCLRVHVCDVRTRVREGGREGVCA